jgi:hypothetical protein
LSQVILSLVNFGLAIIPLYILCQINCNASGFHIGKPKLHPDNCFNNCFIESWFFDEITGWLETSEDPIIVTTVVPLTFYF